ncbi:nuclear transport factor 2 family protein [Rhodococcus opacus]|nr:nuclear transport factor 2 family protein [Rhodococcus opacus]
MRSFWTSDSTVHFPTGTCHGSDEIAVYFDQVFAAVSDFDHFVIAGGKVVTNTVRYDQMEFARQIKLLPPDGSIADRALKAAFNATTRVVGIARRR